MSLQSIFAPPDLCMILDKWPVFLGIIGEYFARCCKLLTASDHMTGRRFVKGLSRIEVRRAE